MTELERGREGRAGNIGQTPWLTIVGLGEDGAAGLAPTSRAVIEAATQVIGSARHLALLAQMRAMAPADQHWHTWPVPFADGLPMLLAWRGHPVVLLASGDPFWFGAGTSVTRALAPGEWQALPAPSTFGLAAARMGWPLEQTTCLGLHAAPLGRLRPHLAPGVRLLVLLRDGAAVGTLAAWLVEAGFDATAMAVLEALGGPRERRRDTTAQSFALTDIAHPVAVALDVAGDGLVIPRCNGLPDALFAHDGQLTKQPVRALALSALAPRPGERLWDLGAGSGSIGIEWLLAHPQCEAVAVEADAERAARLRGNAERLGVDRLAVVVGRAPEALAGLPPPHAVFIGGGLSEDLLGRAVAVAARRLPAGGACGDAGVRSPARRLARARRRQLAAHRAGRGAAVGHAPRLARGIPGRAMARHEMIVAGFGWRQGATPDSLRAALVEAQAQLTATTDAPTPPGPLMLLATAEDKADAPACRPSPPS